MSFKDVSVDDQVVVTMPGPARRKNICHVEKVTATQFTAGGYRFNKRNGWEIGGDSYYSVTVEKATPELIKQVELEQHYTNARDALRRRLDSLDILWREIDRNHDSFKWAGTFEKALPHLTAAVETLKLRQVEIEQ